MEGFLKSGKIRPILTDKNNSFAELTQFLKSRKSVSLKVQGIKTTEKNAKFLDSCLNESLFIRISQDRLDTRKTEISKTFLNKLPEAIPALEPFFKEIILKFNREYDKSGVIRGSWWNSLAKNGGIEGLSAFDDYLSEIGTIIFDFAYSSLTKSSLMGHSYRTSLQIVSEYSNECYPKVEIELRNPDLLESEIPISAFGVANLPEKSFKFFNDLSKSISKSRNRYFDSANKLEKVPTEENLKETKQRLDEYMLAISKEIELPQFNNYYKSLKEAKKLKSKISIWKGIDTYFIGFSIGITAAKLYEPILANPLCGILIVFGVASGVHVVKSKLSSMISDLSEKYDSKKHETEHLRPIELRIVRRKE